ncbi:MAG: ligand-binding sensor domain-containing protein [Glaciecola sp.]|jgi:ligand-binding sensor domain-containing protein
MKYFISLLFILLFGTLFSQGVLVKNQSQLLNKSINCMVGDNYALWTGSDKGLNRIEILIDSVTHVSARPTTKPVLSICNDHKLLWVGITGKGLYLFDKRTYVFKGKFKKELGSKSINFIEKKGTLLFLLTEKNESFVINLKDSTIKAESKSESINYNSTKSLLHKGTKYRASKKGILILNRAGAEQEVVIKEVLEDSTTVLKLDSSQLTKKHIKTNKADSNVISESEVLVESSLNQRSAASEKYYLKDYLWLLFPLIAIYTFILVKILSMKYKKDIRILEDEVLKLKKK